MKIPTTISILLIISLSPMIWSCRQGTGHSSVEWIKERKNIETPSIISIDDALPPLHRGHMLLKGDTLIIHDYKSTDKLFTAFDITGGVTLGSFGNYGNGPGEMANIGGTFLDDKGNLYGFNMNQMILQGINIDMALANDSLSAFTKVKIDTSEGLKPIKDCHYVNDSTVLCSVFGYGAFDYITHYGKFNPQTGVGIPIDTIPVKTIGKNNISVDVENNRVYMTSRQHDRMYILDLDGNVLKTAYGPDYSAEADNKMTYYVQSAIYGDYLYAVYAGKNKTRMPSGTELIVMDKDGHYIKTLKFDAPICGMAFHEKTKRLYLNTLGEPQFGYIQLDD